MKIVQKNKYYCPIRFFFNFGSTNVGNPFENLQFSSNSFIVLILFYIFIILIVFIVLPLIIGHINEKQTVTVLQVPFGINQKLFKIVSSQFDILTVRTEHGIEFMIFGIEASQNWTQAVFEPTTAMDC